MLISAAYVPTASSRDHVFSSWVFSYTTSVLTKLPFASVSNFQILIEYGLQGLVLSTATASLTDNIYFSSQEFQKALGTVKLSLR